MSEVKYPCVQCGFCCGVGRYEGPTICAYGESNKDKTTCRFIKIDDEELRTYKCLIYEEIKVIEEGSKYPMFGCGCSSSLFNNIRDEVIGKMKADGR
ncbi:hypothetical protein LCGC14_1621800 [marine sediment metagenome]|uniref:Uncharacterized protein n=1 Tax=marine sediment metagenome TaxID=412755 RepID=A0A0F9IS98_9ZZZZ